MKKLSSAILLSSLLATCAWSTASAAPGDASEGSGDARALPLEDVQIQPGARSIMPKLEAGEETRAGPITDENKAVESMSVLTRTKDGQETRTAPSDTLRNLVIQELKGEEGGEARKLEKAEDPAIEAEDANRQVFGSDDRVQITNTKAYPFTTIGYIQGKAKSGNYGSCSGALIGPRTVLTAAHCLYNHDDGGWLDEVIFVPGLNGPEDAPFGGYAAESVSIVEGYVTNYQGYYGSVLPWDLGIITLGQPIGDQLGWLGYAHYDGLGDFTANIVGYPGDKPPATMWRATCQVIAEAIGDGWFQYDCDTFPGSSGSAVYAYDNSSKQRIVLGVNVAESPDANTAVRLNAGYVEWVNSLWK